MGVKSKRGEAQYVIGIRFSSAQSEGHGDLRLVWVRCESYPQTKWIQVPETELKRELWFSFGHGRECKVVMYGVNRNRSPLPYGGLRDDDHESIDVADAVALSPNLCDLNSVFITWFNGCHRFISIYLYILLFRPSMDKRRWRYQMLAGNPSGADIDQADDLPRLSTDQYWFGSLRAVEQKASVAIWSAPLPKTTLYYRSHSRLKSCQHSLTLTRRLPQLV